MEPMRLLLADTRRWLGARSPVARWSMLGGAIGVPFGLLVAVVVLATGGGGGDAPVVVATPPRETATAAPSAQATPAAATSTPVVGSIRAGAPGELADPFYGVGEIPPALETGPLTVSTLGELTELHGPPPDATLGRFRIPVLGVDAPLGQRFVSGSTMPNPTGPGDVVWYDLSQWEGLGGVPGGGGNAIFSGHVDYFAPVAWAEAIYRGRGVFFDLGLLSPGDVIEVEVGANVYRYAVQWREQVSAGLEGNWASILASDVSAEALTLITCGGDFDLSERSYQDRVVVRAHRV